MIHLGLRQNFAGNRVDPVERIPCVNNQNTVYQQRAAGRTAASAAAKRIRPVQRGRIGIYRRLDGHNGIVAARAAAACAAGIITCSAEISPLGRQGLDRFVFLRRAECHPGARRAVCNGDSVLIDFQNQRAGCAVCRINGSAPTRIAGAGQQISVGKAVKQFICTVRIRPDARSGKHITDKQQRVRRRQLRRKENRLGLAHLNPVF